MTRTRERAHFRLIRGGAPLRRPVYTSRPETSYSYDYRLARRQYGTPVVGDLFNDVMASVVPGWDNRPEWMKKIQVKPDPARLLQTATKIVPPSAVGGVVKTANQYGFDLWYRTPAGNVPVSPAMAESFYGNYPAFARFQQGLSNIPGWVYLGGAGVVLLLIGLSRRGR